MKGKLPWNMGYLRVQGFLQSHLANESKWRKAWYDKDYLGIDQGPILIMTENYRTGLIWKLLKKDSVVVRGLKKAGFSGGWLNIK